MENIFFLEVNPQGEWGMLQRDLGLPIGEAIAIKLVNRITKNELEINNKKHSITV